MSLSDFLNREVERALAKPPSPYARPVSAEPPPEYEFDYRLVKCSAPPMPERGVDVEATRQRMRHAAEEYLGERSPEHMLLLRAAPGTGKTTLMADIANTLALGGQRVLYAAQRHEFFTDLQRAAMFNGHDPRLWYEWQPRTSEPPEATCQHAAAVNRWARKGYRAIDFCIGVCGNRYMGECPYIQQSQIKNPLIMGQHQHVTLGHPLEFAVVIGDESPLGAFQNTRYLTPEAMEHAIDNQWQLPHYSLVDMLGKLSQCEDVLLEGPALFGPNGLGDAAHVVEICQQANIPLNAVLAETDLPHSVEEADNRPDWFLPQLLYLVNREATLAVAGRDYPHRVLVGNGVTRLLFRHTVSEKLPPHVIWTDATARTRLYEALFQRPVIEVHAAPDLHGNVYQIVDRANGKSALTDDATDDAGETITTASDKAAQARAFIERMIAEHGYVNPVVISFQALESQWHTAQAGHFYGERGTNVYEDCDAVFVVGAPLPNLKSIVRLAAIIFFERDTPFNTRWHSIHRPYTYRDAAGVGRAYPVGGFWADADLQTVVETFREDEILQTAHRVRPILAPKDVWLLTNIPVTDLPPTALLTMRAALGAPPAVSIWNWAQLMDALADVDTLTTSDLMRYADVSRPTAYKYMQLLEESGEWGTPDADEQVLTRRRGRPTKTLVRKS